ncbi:unnamed protein product [Peronospora belbahrii]|uniref:Peptidase S1 domain-containing protein n=1 Tax=Peronospora belbahrii TaxID=622444 RepID=A0AAU9L662_9STRA|nr:unnamed protein product [Peronospora belbahrii]CAH0515522.1 unnamed protein product [Peronospora belbahrii]
MTFTAVIRAGGVFAFALVAALTEGSTFVETSTLTSGSASKEESTGLTINDEARIFDGSEANPSQFPFVVSLRKDKAGGKTYCGGTLIASQYVLTAAHCVKTDVATIYASIGSASGSGTSDGQQIKVIRGYRHPKYNQSAHLYDIGMFKLEKAVEAETIELGAVNGSDNKVGHIATVAGWGLTETGSQSLLLEKVNVPIISNAECNKQYNNRITEGMLCAGDGEGKDTCSGDSGGPLIANNVLIGIVSWGGKCGVNSGVYTRISYVRDYIIDIVKGGDGSTFASKSSSARSELSNEMGASSTTTKRPVTASPMPMTDSNSVDSTKEFAAIETESSSTDQHAPLTDESENFTKATDQSKWSSTNDVEQSNSNTASPLLISLTTDSTKKTRHNKKKCDSQL